MIQEAIQYLFDLGVKSASRIVKSDAEPSHVYFKRAEDGELERVEAAPSPASHTAFDLTAICDLAVISKNPAIWYGRSGVVLVRDMDTRRDVVKLPVGYSIQMQQLLELDRNSPQLNQAQIIKLLRIKFKESLGAETGLISILRKVKFNATQSGESDIKHGSSSVGKQLTAEVQGTSSIPEYITLSVPIFSHASFVGIKQSVLCALEPDASTQTFQLIPIPGQTEKAIADGEIALRDQIHELLGEGHKVAVYYGQP